ncbi:F-box only protein 6 [Acorus calamus]|uniref:F-box only protein 6 n=1 Tax=Acorus calamus TaxID=4465 RepID=A0AAV9F0X8_ACOCL|nr:F-box only protein 6 [Acorus calamus]
MIEANQSPPIKKPRREKNRETISSIESSTEAMEPHIWKELPEDIFEAVIARLPVTTVFRFRLVCRKWNSLLTSGSFRLAHRAHPWFYSVTHENENSGLMYDPSLKKWHHHSSIPSLPSKTIVLPVASTGGLICFLDVGHRNFYVCNPLTQSFKELPSRSVRVWSRVAVGMTLNGTSYKILWLACNGDHEIYDSVMNRWTRPGNIPSTGRLMLVGLLTKNAATCVGVWELQRMTLLWKEVDRMPNIWCLEFYGKHVRMTCLGNRGLIMLSLRSSQMSRLVTYDVSSREWHKVPGGRVREHGRTRQWITWGTAFHPCPAAVA